MVSYLSAEKSKRAFVQSLQSAFVVKDTQELYDLLLGIKKAKKPKNFKETDPVKLTDTGRKDLYKQIITDVMGKDFYDRLDV